MKKQLTILSLALLTAFNVMGQESSGESDSQTRLERWRDFLRKRQEWRQNHHARNPNKSSGSYSRKITDKSEDGVSWTAEGSHTNRRGTSSFTADGSATKTETGDGVKWKADKSGTTASGKDWQAKTVGKGKKTDDGHQWKKATVGKGENGGKFGRAATGQTARNGKKVSWDKKSLTRFKKPDTRQNSHLMLTI